MEDTVAITIDANSPAIVVPRIEAEVVYNQLSTLTLTHDMDRKLLAALKVGLGVLPPPTLAYGTGEESLAERKLREWKERGAPPVQQGTASDRVPCQRCSVGEKERWQRHCDQCEASDRLFEAQNGGR